MTNLSGSWLKKFINQKKKNKERKKERNKRFDLFILTFIIKVHLEAEEEMQVTKSFLSRFITLSTWLQLIRIYEKFFFKRVYLCGILLNSLYVCFFYF